MLLLVNLVPVSAQDNNGKKQGGEGKYANLSALWWQWIYGQPAIDVNGTNTNPVLDSTGASASAGQENGINKYFFLAGAFGGVATRTVTVPAGKALFFPVINSEWDNFPACSPTTTHTVPELRAIAQGDIDSVTEKHASLDGVPLEIFRTKSPTFGYTVPAENDIYSFLGCGDPRYAGGVKPAVADGYWSYLPPLAPGEYTLNFGGATSSGFSLDVTYHLTVQQGASASAGAATTEEPTPMRSYLPLMRH
jgi:hypothetical protein